MAEADDIIVPMRGLTSKLIDWEFEGGIATVECKAGTVQNSEKRIGAPEAQI